MVATIGDMKRIQLQGGQQRRRRISTVVQNFSVHVELYRSENHSISVHNVT